MSHTLDRQKLLNYFNFDFSIFNQIDCSKVNKVYKFSNPRFFIEQSAFNANSPNLQATFFLDDYLFSLRLENFKEKNDNVVLICIKDNSELLDFVLSKIKKSADENCCDILVIDDRPENDSVFQVAIKNQISYLQVSNSADIYSYSMLNNIAVYVASVFGKKTCLCWNCDMWPADDQCLSSLLNKHFEHNACLSGTRLIYPSEADHRQILKWVPNTNQKIGDQFGKIQHGGIYFQPFSRGETRSSIIFEPVHQWRYFESDHFLACRDMPIPAVTGAFWIINCKDFIEAGGLNPSLPCILQDIDFCLKLTMNKKMVYYLGSNFLYHAEGFFHTKFKTAEDVKISDKTIYHCIWAKHIEVILGLTLPPKN